MINIYLPQLDRFFWGNSLSTCLHLRDSGEHHLKYIRHIAASNISHKHVEEFLKTSPAEVCIEITKKCDFHCPICIADAGENLSDLNLHDVHNLLSNIPSTVKRITITGGEPLLHQDILKILSELKGRFEGIILSTCGDNLNLLKEVVQLGVVTSFELSLHGVGKAHDQYVGRKGTFNKVIQSIEWLLNNKQRIEILTTATSSTIGSIIDLITFLNRYSFAEHRINLIKDKGRIVQQREEFTTISEIVRSCKRLNKTTIKESNQPYLFLGCEGVRDYDEK